MSEIMDNYYSRRYPVSLHKGEPIKRCIPWVMGTHTCPYTSYTAYRGIQSGILNGTINGLIRVPLLPRFRGWFRGSIPYQHVRNPHPVSYHKWYRIPVYRVPITRTPNNVNSPTTTAGWSLWGSLHTAYDPHYRYHSWCDYPVYRYIQCTPIKGICVDHPSSVITSRECHNESCNK